MEFNSTNRETSLRSPFYPSSSFCFLIIFILPPPFSHISSKFHGRLECDDDKAELGENTHDLQEVKGISNSSSQFPGRVYYVAQLRNEAYIRETLRNRTRVIFLWKCILQNSDILATFFLGFSKL